MIGRFAIAAGTVFLALVGGQNALGQVITKRVTVQPIRISSGTETANSGGVIFTEVTAKIFAQINMEVKFLPMVDVVLPDYLNLYSSPAASGFNLINLTSAANNGASSDPSVLNLWFVKTIDNTSSALGFSRQSSIDFTVKSPENGIAIANSAFTYGGGVGRLDIFAHEIGHNLGLYHDIDEEGTVQASGSQNLMTAGTSRTSPTSLLQVFPDGTDLDQLNNVQKTRIYAFNNFVKDLPAEDQYFYSSVPEPKVYALATALGVLAWGIVRRRKQAAQPK